MLQKSYHATSSNWGVIPILVGKIKREELHTLARQEVLSHHMASADDNILLVRGFHPDPKQSVPSITILCV